MNSGSTKSPQSPTFELKDAVWVRYKSGVYNGYVQALNGGQVKVRFTYNGYPKSKSYEAREVYTTKEEAEAN